MTRVVYHLETHRNPRQVNRLVTTLRDQAPDAVIVVNHDETAPQLDGRTLQSLDVVVMSGRGGYSDLSHVRRYLQTVDWLEQQGVDYDWLSNLSGQCYPLRPLAQVHAELESSPADAFVETFDTADPDESTWGLRLADTRYGFAHRRLRSLSHRQMQVLRPVQAVNRVQPWVRVTTATGLTVGRRVPSPFGSQLSLRGGSFFTTMRRAAVDHVRDFAEQRTQVMDHLQRCLAPAEVFFQTALATSESLTVVNDCRRYFDFSHTRYNRPKTLSSADLPAMVASGKDFGRKLDLDRDPTLFDLLDQQLLAAAGQTG